MSLTKASFSMIKGAPINVLDWGAVGDNSTDNTSAFMALSAWVNEQPRTGVPFPIYFPAGTYKYGTNGLNFHNPVYLFSDEAATLYFTGTASNAMDLGKPGLAYGQYIFDNAEYTVDGLRFTSDYGCNHGIALRPFVLSARIRNVSFIDFGGNDGDTGYCIYGQNEIWDTVIENCRLFAINRSTARMNFIGFPGVSDAGVSDGGNSRVTMSNCMMTSFATSPAVDLGVYAQISGTGSRILGGSFVNSSYGILLTPDAQDVIIDSVYAEMADNALAYITVVSKTIDGNVYVPQGAVVTNAYINFHEHNIPMIKCFDANVRLVDWTIDHVVYGDIVDNQLMIEQQAWGNQYHNIATGFKKLTIPLGADNGRRAQIFNPNIAGTTGTWADPSNVFGVEVVTETTYTLQQFDSGKFKRLTGAATVVTVPNSLSNPNIPVGSIVYLHNTTGGNQTIVGAAGVTLSLLGTATTGTRTIGANGLARLINSEPNVWLVDGPGVT
jgi:hypothetical protein